MTGRVWKGIEVSDKKGQELLRAAKSGDGDAAAAAIVHGARREEASLVLDAINASVGSLDSKVLDQILYAVGAEIASREVVSCAGRDQYKAGELHMPSLGKMSLGRLIHEVVEFVEKLQNGDKGAGKLMRAKYGGWRRPGRTRTTAEQIKSAKEVLAKADGIMVGCSSVLRIYALKPEDKDKAKKRLEKKAREIEKKARDLESQKKAHEKALRDFEKEKLRLDAALEKSREEIKKAKEAL